MNHVGAFLLMLALEGAIYVLTPPRRRLVWVHPLSPTVH